MILASYISVLCLSCYQDVRYRGIHWLLFPLLLAGSFLANDGWTWQQLGMNFTFIVFLLLMLTLYVSIKHRKLLRITDGFFSWGDILFLLAITPLFAFDVYVMYVTFGTCLSLLFHGIASLIKKQETIPYAGYMAIATIAFMALHDKLQPYLALEWRW